ncbi:hypothetical protein SUGI_1016020 [Cryptomeria japonica]|nr:hypothetical protein SUGI_1016020 [Cryptomeria japonica]
MEEQGTGGDQTPLYSQVYDKLQQFRNHNFNLQQQHGIAPFNGASYYNGTAPSNGESHNNNNHYRQEQAQRQTLQQEQFQMVPQKLLQTPQQTHIHRQIQRQQQPPIMKVQITQRQHMNMEIPRIDLQQQNQNGNVHPQDMGMQFQPRQNIEMEIQQMQLLQQHNMDQSNNVNANVVSLTASHPIPPPDGEKRKRGRPRKLFNQADNRAAKLPFGSSKTPRYLQFEYGEPGLFRVIVIAPGEDVHEKVMSFYQQQTSLTVCIISAKGIISNVEFQEVESRRIVNHKGEFEILSLSRSYTKDNNGLRVTLIHLDGKIFRGIVGGLLIAASFVEVVVGVFSSDAVYIPGQVGDKGPISISGQPNTEVYSAISDV